MIFGYFWFVLTATECHFNTVTKSDFNQNIWFSSAISLMIVIKMFNGCSKLWLSLCFQIVVFNQMYQKTTAFNLIPAFFNEISLFLSCDSLAGKQWKEIFNSTTKETSNIKCDKPWQKISATDPMNRSATPERTSEWANETEWEIGKLKKTIKQRTIAQQDKYRKRGWTLYLAHANIKFHNNLLLSRLTHCGTLHPQIAN